MMDGGDPNRDAADDLNNGLPEYLVNDRLGRAVQVVLVNSES